MLEISPICQMPIPRKAGERSGLFSSEREAEALAIHAGFQML